MSSRILVLGSGYVSKAVIHYLEKYLQSPTITVGSVVLKELEILRYDYPSIRTINVDVTEEDFLKDVIKDVDIVLSLVPNHMHLPVARCCIESKAHLITASYCTPAIASLHHLAVSAKVTILNEIGLDPGIDHFLAMRHIDRIHKSDGQIVSFVSHCGGLPAPEFANNALHYKFSWSPITALGNLYNEAHYLLNGEEIVVPGRNLLHATEDITFLPEWLLEGHPNRNSVKYKELYAIPNAKTVMRGTLRYRGFANAVSVFKDVGLLEKEPWSLFPADSSMTWKELVNELIRRRDWDLNEFEEKVLNELGFLSNGKVEFKSSPLETLCKMLESKLSLGVNETDVAILRHEIIAEYALNNVKERTEIILIVHGDAGGLSAMGKSVGASMALAAKLILSGTVEAGVILPFSSHLYEPILQGLEQEQIRPQEAITIQNL